MAKQAELPVEKTAAVVKGKMFGGADTMEIDGSDHEALVAVSTMLSLGIVNGN